MKPVLKSLVISTVVVVGYPIVVFAIICPFAGVLLSPLRADALLNYLWMPLDLPGFTMRSLHPSEHVSLGRVPIEHTLLVLSWFIAFNAVIYYIPIRMFVEWREQKSRLP